MGRGTDMDSVVVSDNTQRTKITDVVKLLDYPKVKGKPGWVTIRLFGPVYSQASFWVKTKTKAGKITQFPAPCRCYDPETHQVVADKYDPFYDEYRRELDENVPQAERLLTYSRYFYMQAIVRKAQDAMPARNRLTAEEKSTGIKDMDSDSVTPVVVVRMTNRLFKAIQELKEDNIVKLKSGTRTAYNVNHEKYGRDIMVKYDDSEGVSPSDRYQVKLVVDGGRTPLTEEEKSYLKYDLDAIYAGEQSEAEVKKDYEGWAKRMGLIKDKKKALKDEDIDEDVDDLEDDDDFDDEDEAPKKKKVVKKAKKKVVEDDDDFDDEDDFDDDEDEESAPKKKAKKPVKKVVKKKVEEDDDDDFDDDFDDEDEEPTPKKKSKKVEEEAPWGDDEDDFDDDDDEEEKPSKKKKVVKKKVEEDEDDDFDDDFDDEEEETPKPKKVVKKKPVKKATKKKPVEEDDDDDFDEDEEW